MTRKLQGFEDVGEGKDAYLEHFRSNAGIRVVEQFSSFMEKSSDWAGEVDRTIIWLAQIDAPVSIVASCLTEQIKCKEDAGVTCSQAVEDARTNFGPVVCERQSVLAVLVADGVIYVHRREPTHVVQVPSTNE